MKVGEVHGLIFDYFQNKMDFGVKSLTLVFHGEKYSETLLVYVSLCEFEVYKHSDINTGYLKT